MFPHDMEPVLPGLMAHLGAVFVSTNYTLGRKILQHRPSRSAEPGRNGRGFRVVTVQVASRVPATGRLSLPTQLGVTAGPTARGAPPLRPPGLDAARPTDSSPRG